MFVKNSVAELQRISSLLMFVAQREHKEANQVFVFYQLEIDQKY